MGEIVFWTIMRAAAGILLVWYVKPLYDSAMWWFALMFFLYLFIVHPALMQYRLFIESTKDIVHKTLCSSCKSFDASAVLCMKYDEHPTRTYIPCEGRDWQPGDSSSDTEEAEF